MTNKSPQDKTAAQHLHAEILVNLGNTMSQACQTAGISQSDYLQWRKKTVDLKMDGEGARYLESKEQSEAVLKTTEQLIRAKIYQQILVGVLQDKKTISPNLIQKIWTFYSEADTIRQILLDTIHGEAQKKIPIACTKGCSYCCGLKAATTEPELIIIRNHLLDRSSKQQLKELVEGLRQFVSRLQISTTRSEKLAVKCSFLEDGACGIYEVRPLACRAWNSTDVEVCKRYLVSTEEDIPASICHYAPYDVVKKGITQGLFVTGFDPPSEELNSGMLRLLGG